MPKRLANGTCNADKECLSGVCLAGTAGTKICSVPLDEGQTCLTDASCKEGLVCAEAVGDDGKRQEAYTPKKQCIAPKEAGKFCVESSDCKTGLSCIDYVDDKDGSVYSYKDSSFNTLNKLVCSELKSAGEYCAQDSNCKGDLVCSIVLDNNKPIASEARKCSEQKSSGAYCAENNDCKSGRCSGVGEKTCK